MEQLPEDAFHEGHRKTTSTSSNKSEEVDLRREQFKDALSKTIAAGGQMLMQPATNIARDESSRSSLQLEPSPPPRMSLMLEQVSVEHKIGSMTSGSSFSPSFDAQDEASYEDIGLKDLESGQVKYQDIRTGLKSNKEFNS